MKEFKSIYPFEVIETIKNTHKVYMLDREEAEVTTVTEMSVGDFISVLAISEKEPNRFDFWVEKEKENNTDE